MSPYTSSALLGVPCPACVAVAGQPCEGTPAREYHEARHLELAVRIDEAEGTCGYCGTPVDEGEGGYCSSGCARGAVYDGQHPED